MSGEWLEMILDSLRSRPHDWDFCKFDCTHKSGIELRHLFGTLSLHVAKPFEATIPFFWKITLARAIVTAKHQIVIDKIRHEELKAVPSWKTERPL